MRPRVALIACLLAIMFVSDSSAIIIRHDQDDQRYVSLGRRIAGICHLNLQKEGSLPDGEGVLVGPRWILTAAHVAVMIKAGHTLTVVADTLVEDVVVGQVFMHPDWDDGPHDLALVWLSEPARRIKSVSIGRFPVKEGDIITVGGYGDYGTGRTGPTMNDGKVRGARNKVDEVSDNWLKFRFDKPDDAVDLEGISGPGDSGGPAFLRRGDSVYVVGVSSGQSTRDTDGQEGVYGVREYYTRISSYLDWIDQIMREQNLLQE